MRRALVLAGAAVAGVLCWLWHDAGRRVAPPHRVPFEPLDPIGPADHAPGWWR